ncbi:MAG: carbohydrate kinase [Flavobacterium sp.]|nr:carbohydrate kinase [Flavobacterium sp.]
MTQQIVCFGEVLWDVLPTESIAGGAPMNVAIRLQSVGIQSSIISKIGNDQLGQSLIDMITDRKVETSLIQIDKQLPTGEVLVHLDAKGSATYDIVYPSAWDGIVVNDSNINAVKAADALVFGSLACRDQVSKSTLFELLPHAKYTVFDVNIRPPFYSISLLLDLMNLSDFIKLNDDELLEVASELGSKSKDIEENIQFLSQLTDTETICITKGDKGAVLYKDNTFYTHEGFNVEVADTIGAGDSFLAALLSKVLYQDDCNDALEYACAVGALVASKKGANPTITSDQIFEMINKNK